MRTFVFCFVALLGSIANGQTLDVVRGQTLTLSGINTYDRITVYSGGRLVIEPGSEIVFKHLGWADIRGTLEAVGTTEKPIVFRSIDSSICWRGIQSNNTSRTLDAVVKLHHCVVSGVGRKSTDTSTSNRVAVGVGLYGVLDLDQVSIECEKHAKTLVRGVIAGASRPASIRNVTVFNANVGLHVASATDLIIDNLTAIDCNSAIEAKSAVVQVSGLVN